MRPSFLRVATRPKWIGALFIALAAAALCALLAQWQLGRSIRVTNDPNTIDTAVQLSTITQPGKAVTDKLADKRAFETVKVEANSCVVVENRYQLNDDGTSSKGFWVLSDSTDTLGAHLWLAHGFAANEKTAKDVCTSRTAATEAHNSFITQIGRYEPSEEVQPQVSSGYPSVFASMSVAQLINDPSAKPAAVYTGVLVLETAGYDPRLAPIKIGINHSQNQLSLLNAFYAIEWTLFAGFAVFMWYRLVQDERTRIEEEAAEASKSKKLN